MLTWNKWFSLFNWLSPSKIFSLEISFCMYGYRNRFFIPLWFLNDIAGYFIHDLRTSVETSFAHLCTLFMKWWLWFLNFFLNCSYWFSWRICCLCFRRFFKLNLLSSRLLLKVNNSNLRLLNFKRPLYFLRESLLRLRWHKIKSSHFLFDWRRHDLSWGWQVFK